MVALNRDLCLFVIAQCSLWLTVHSCGLNRASVVGGLSMDPPRGRRCCPPTGTSRHGLHTVTPSPCTCAGALRAAPCFPGGFQVHVLSGLLHNEV